MSAFYTTYTTVDGKIIALPHISYIDAIRDTENGLKQFKVIQLNGSEIIVEHEDEQELLKDWRKLAKKWAGHLHSNGVMSRTIRP
jgi:hypothetical protein